MTPLGEVGPSALRLGLASASGVRQLVPGQDLRPTRAIDSLGLRRWLDDPGLSFQKILSGRPALPGCRLFAGTGRITTLSITAASSIRLSCSLADSH